jgi:hypothetical protein
MCHTLNSFFFPKMPASWDIALCSLVETDRRFRGAYSLHEQGGESVETDEISEVLSISIIKAMSL